MTVGSPRATLNPVAPTRCDASPHGGAWQRPGSWPGRQPAWDRRMVGHRPFRGGAHGSSRPDQVFVSEWPAGRVPRPEPGASCRPTKSAGHIPAVPAAELERVPIAYDAVRSHADMATSAPMANIKVE
jgi:hypothetical protein